MSYHDQAGGYPPPREQELQYPPPPGEEEEPRHYHQRAPSNNSVTLPSISPYEYQPPHNSYPVDPRYVPDPYNRQPPPPVAYNRDHQPAYDYARTGPPAMNFSQSAPRQRTAIACRYCRRRKIRCSGFGENPEGRCSNCQRFQQECIFTPVSSQAQAFVPAHAVYPGMRNLGPDGRPRPPIFPQGTQLYGAHGQPLNRVEIQPAPGYNEYGQPSPTSTYSSFNDDRPVDSRKRLQPEPHPSILPPPIRGQPGYPQTEPQRRAGGEEDLRLPPPLTPTAGAQTTSNYSPGSSTSSHSNLQPPQVPTSARTPPPRTSPSDGRSDPMSLGSIMEQRPNMEIDRNMLGRLDRKT